MMRRVLLIAGLVLAASGGAAAPAAAAADPAAVIGRLGNEGLAALGPNIAPAERVARFRGLFERDFDTETIARFVLGRYWRIASGPQREEFHRLFTEYLALVYSQRLATFGGAHLKVTGTRDGPDGQLVQTSIERPNGPPAEIQWRVTPIGGTYKVVDVIVGGASMAATQREEFSALIQRSGGAVDGLLTAMRERVQGGAEGSNSGGSTRPATGSTLPPPRQ